MTAAILLTRKKETGLSVPINAGLLFSLLILTRLDGLLFAAVGAISWFIQFDRMNSGRQLVRCTAMLIPLGITLAFYTAFSLTYYGDFFSNAFLFKIGHIVSYVSQRVLYIALYLAKNWYLIIAAVGVLILLKQKTLNLEKQKRLTDPLFASSKILVQDNCDIRLTDERESFYDVILSPFGL